METKSDKSDDKIRILESKIRELEYNIITLNNEKKELTEAQKKKLRKLIQIFKETNQKIAEFENKK